MLVQFHIKLLKRSHSYINSRFSGTNDLQEDPNLDLNQLATVYNSNKKGEPSAIKTGYCANTACTIYR